jgi:2-dehydro-3-deoxygalactonokinase
MSAAAFIAGDWGTSNLRLRLYAADGTVLDSRDGPGAADSRGRFAEVFDGLTAAWRERANLPALLCGMAGSAFGWIEAPYLLCPEDVDNLAGSLARARSDVLIVPGMRCSNPLGAPDVMRGEETQLLGALALHPELAHGRHLVCMPGTHTKWVALHDGTVLEFLTVPTGEIFRLLCEHSVLVRDRATPVTHQAREFERGLVEAGKHAGVPLLHRVFQARSLRLDQQLSAEGAASWTSGLLIGTDCAGALPLFDAATEAPIYIVGAAALVDLYAAALAKLGRPSRRVAGDDAAFGGLVRIHSALADTGKESS